ncbi:MAG: UDP-2,3-diacylglucosamine diphosphatase LpxI [Alphaproteobacteria bacterium]|nr:UDP-2,3-diacylglucosamine diphosphatase LpxI [Alphaproteobacteria bacterium]
MADGALGILAGGGSLPRRIAERAVAEGRRVFVIAFEEQTDPATVDGLDHAWMKLGATSNTLKRLHDVGCTEIVMAGPMRRPSLSSLGLDRRSAIALARAGTRVFGDDGLLSVIVREMEKDGFRVIGVEDILGGYLVPAGLIAGEAVDAAADADIARGIAVLRAMGAEDVGQAVAVQEGLVLAVEAVEGTDAMIERAGALRRDGPGPILVKGTKPGQEARADRPTVGPDTIRAAIAAGFRGMALEAEATLIVDRAEAEAAARDAGMFIVARSFGPQA